MAVNDMPTMDNDDDRQRDGDLDDLIQHWQDNQDGKEADELPPITKDGSDEPTPIDLTHDERPTPEPTEVQGQEFLAPDLPELTPADHETPDTFGLQPQIPEGPRSLPESPAAEPLQEQPPEEAPIPPEPHDDTPAQIPLPFYPLLFPLPDSEDEGKPQVGQPGELPPLDDFIASQAQEPDDRPFDESDSPNPRQDFEASPFNVPQVVTPDPPQVMLQPNDDLFSRTGWPAQPVRTVQTFWY